MKRIKDKKPQTVPVHIDKSVLTEIRKESIENSLTEGMKHGMLIISINRF